MGIFTSKKAEAECAREVAAQERKDAACSLDLTLERVAQALRDRHNPRIQSRPLRIIRNG